MAAAERQADRKRKKRCVRTAGGKGKLFRHLCDLWGEKLEAKEEGKKEQQQGLARPGAFFLINSELSRL